MAIAGRNTQATTTGRVQDGHAHGPAQLGEIASEEAESAGKARATADAGSSTAGVGP